MHAHTVTQIPLSTQTEGFKKITGVSLQLELSAIWQWKFSSLHSVQIAFFFLQDPQ